MFIMALMSLFVLMFGVSWLVNKFMDLMSGAGSDETNIQPVEVVNVGDIGRK